MIGILSITDSMMSQPQVLKDVYGFAPVDRALRVIKRNLIRIKDFVDANKTSLCSEELYAEFESEKKEVAELRSEFKKSLSVLLSLIDKLPAEKQQTTEDEVFKTNDEYQELFRNTASKIEVFLAKRNVVVSQARESLNASFRETIESTATVKYPKIPIPKFDGDIRKFQEFKALFANMVHNDLAMPPVKKLWYLKDALSLGEAAVLVRDISLSEEAYTEAWNRLLERYDNKRAIISAHLNDLFSVQKIKNEMQLRALLNTVDGALRGLKVCGVDTDKWSVLISYFVTSKLDDRTRRDWENTITDNSCFPSYKTVAKFLNNRATNCEAKNFEKNSESSSLKTEKKADNKKSSFSTASKPVTSNAKVCIACGAPHLLIECDDFIAKSPVERFELVKSKKLCFNCFGTSHSSISCKKDKVCKHCLKKHHSLLHRETSSAKPNSQSELTKVGPTEQQKAALATSTSSTGSSMSCQASPSRKTLWLPSAVVKFRAGNIKGLARILLDSCSQPTLVSNSFVKSFRLHTYRAPYATKIKGVGDVIVESDQLCALTLISRTSSFSLDIEADVVPAKTLSHTVNQASCKSIFETLSMYQMADPAFEKPVVNMPHVDLIIGSEYFEKIILNETRSAGSATLRNTNFGWVLSGAVFEPSSRNVVYSNHVTSTVSDIDEQLAKFWRLEEVPSSPASSSEHERCLAHFENTYSRNSEGRFCVRFPLKVPKEEITENRQRALASLLRLERTLNPHLKAAYIEFMREYEQLGHMSIVPECDLSLPSYHIPHRAVIRPDSLTTKLRVVFNASSNDGKGLSLNEASLTGPSIQPELFDTLVRFRTFKVAVCADIEKMYRQVLINEADRDLQRIYWRESPDQPIREYRLNTVTYGTVPASFLATKCLDVLAKEAESESPKVAKSIVKSFYMDDYLGGCNSPEQAVELMQAIDKKLRSAGFILRKYVSNEQEFLDSFLRATSEEMQEVKCLFNEKESPSVLGLIWDAKSDYFSVRLNLPKLLDIKWTKRMLLSEISRVFDPLGLISPVTVRAKILMQSLWREQLKWDDLIPPELISKYLSYRSELRELKDFRISRFLRLNGQSNSQLIGFCDASKYAYCAVVYSRSVDRESNMDCRLVCAKTRVAPVKEITIPKLELEAFVLLAKIVERLRDNLCIDRNNVFCFSDSRVVLSWIKKPPTAEKYVHNRVTKITGLLLSHSCYYVSTKENPADLATRGLSVEKFLKSPQWLTGPEFLFHNEMLYEKLLEPVAEISFCCSLSINVSHESFIEVINSFSSYERLVGTLASIISFFKSRSKVKVSAVEARRLAFNRIVYVLQQHYYQFEINELQKKSDVKFNSVLKSLTPFIDENGLLRVGGRLTNAQLSYDKKHPVIIPARSHFAEIYVRHVHVKFYHAGYLFVMAFVSSKFWFHRNLYRVVKNVIKSCVVCKRFEGKQSQQIMGQLPAARVTIARPFSTVGVDLAGPFTIKCTRHRVIKFIKMYSAIFVCFCTKAVHLEILSELSAESFLLTFRRFVARRGLPSVVWSDNATNFQAVSGVMSQIDPKISNYAVKNNLEWKFIPPKSPNKGGLWESAVKSAKRHLVKVAAGAILTQEELLTMLLEIEAIMNSRPLSCSKLSQGNPFEVITPGHFLIGDSLVAAPEAHSASQVKMSLSQRYQNLRSRINSFWKIWKTDYLTQLQEKSKWKKEMPNVKRGTIVVLKDDGPPSSWSYGKIEEVYPDALGQVRVADVLVKGKLKRRSLSSLVPLVEAED